MDPGLKGCQFLLGTLPAWISLTEREKMEVWFFVSLACSMQHASVPPTFLLCALLLLHHNAQMI